MYVAYLFLSHRSGDNNIARKLLPLISLAYFLITLDQCILMTLGLLARFIHVHQSRV